MTLSFKKTMELAIARAEQDARLYLGLEDALPIERGPHEIINRDDYNVLVRTVREILGK